MRLVDDYIDYLQTIRRRSERTLVIYRGAVERFVAFQQTEDQDVLLRQLNVTQLRNWRHDLLNQDKLSPRTVNQHLSAMSGFCRYLFHRGLLAENPFDLLDRNGKSAIDSVKLRDEREKRVAFFTDEALQKYLEETRNCADGTLLELFSDGKDHKEVYDRITRRMIISFLYGTALRRSELIGLKIGALDFHRGIMTVKGKGGKTREVALADALCGEIRNYMTAVEKLVPEASRTASDPLFVTFAGKELYPVYVDRAVKTELGGREGFKGHKSPHVLRHSLATELLTEGADIYSVGKFLGHSSIAATQIYTHGDIKQLKKVYGEAFPRKK